MLTPQQLLRITIEIIFVLLGGLVVWLGLTGAHPVRPAKARLVAAERGGYLVGPPRTVQARRVVVANRTVDARALPGVAWFGDAGDFARFFSMGGPIAGVCRLGACRAGLDRLSLDLPSTLDRSKYLLS